MKIPFSPPYIDNDVIAEVTDALQSGWITTGPKAKALEQSIKDFTHCKACNAVNSWTSGAVLALKWLELKPDDEVIVPSYTYCATAMAVIEAGGKPVMVDIDNDFAIDPQQVLKAITPKTKAVLPVDIGGNPCDYPLLKEIISSPEALKLFSPWSENQKKLGRILLISDSAHSLGAKINSQHVATLADITVLSFHAVKNITSAEGGMICLNLPEPFDNEALQQWFKIMSLNGQTKDAFAKTQLASWQYDVIDTGMKINLPDVNAAIALAQMRKYGYLLKERKRIFERYNSCLQQYEWAVLPFENRKENVTMSYHLYPLRIKDITPTQRNRIIDIMALQNIATNVHYIPLPELTVFKNMGFSVSNYPVAKATFEHEITLPLYPQLTDAQVDFVLDNLIKAHDKAVKNQ
ncbi:MAG: DegT/DnrJ/EryC1/StrS family aminotransferase [Bacteroidales bacterium]|nr:DegT/DnrJ/EryC1/StrS family aminotransferase [Bacteroidales bacterium]MBP3254729.1 DegT/DnrJ/EryC1/StrS family aminotransferase [Bacteroidales bacterium]